MKRTPLDHMNCSVARSLDIVGEWWTLLIIRDLFRGIRRFEAIREDLGISRKVLSDRLATLVERDIVVKVPVERGFEEYRLTEKGIDLHSVVVALMMWGDKWEAPNGAPLILVHTCGNSSQPHLTCNCCGEEVTAFNVKATNGPGHSSKVRA